MEINKTYLYSSLLGLIFSLFFYGYVSSTSGLDTSYFSFRIYFLVVFGILIGLISSKIFLLTSSSMKNYALKFGYLAFLIVILFSLFQVLFYVLPVVSRTIFENCKGVGPCYTFPEMINQIGAALVLALIFTPLSIFIPAIIFIVLAILGGLIYSKIK